MSSSIQIQTLDQTELLLSQVRSACEKQQPLAVQGNGSKLFLIHPVSGECLSTSAHQGIISYFPSELTITVRSGTLLSELKEVLKEQGQMLAFEPPAFSDNATIGGTIAAGLSGPSRPFTGSARDFVLGCKIINGRGELLKFGGEVMKNVAGYDLSRLITGSYGSLGVILEVSLKLLPIVAKQQSLRFSLQSNQFAHQIQSLLMSGHPVNAACYLDGQAYIRLGGSGQGVASSYQKISQTVSAQHSQLQDVDNSFWSELNEQQLAFFDHSQPLWRLSLPAISKKTGADDFAQFLTTEDRYLFDWGGALFWLYSNQSADKIRQYAQSQGGHAQLFRVNEMDNDSLKSLSKQQPLSPVMLKIHQQIKSAIDPQLILNQGCIYPEL